MLKFCNVSIFVLLCYALVKYTQGPCFKEDINIIPGKPQMGRKLSLSLVFVKTSSSEPALQK